MHCWQFSIPVNSVIPQSRVPHFTASHLRQPYRWSFWLTPSSAHKKNSQLTLQASTPESALHPNQFVPQPNQFCATVQKRDHLFRGFTPHITKTALTTGRISWCDLPSCSLLEQSTQQQMHWFFFQSSAAIKITQGSRLANSHVRHLASCPGPAQKNRERGLVAFPCIFCWPLPLKFWGANQIAEWSHVECDPITYARGQKCRLCNMVEQLVMASSVSPTYVRQWCHSS